ncbi:MAG: hypothetical protein IJ400_06295 [Clostridia bacterium]|nr:hypothetical protein [Clostridia bacterium]
MKKLKILLFVLLIAIFAFSACTLPPSQEETGGTGTVPNTTTGTDTANSQIADTSTQGGLTQDPLPQLPSDPQAPNELDPVLARLDKALANAINGYESLTTIHDLIIVKSDSTLTLGTRLHKSTKDQSYTSELINSLNTDFESTISRKEIRTLDDGALGIDTIYGVSYYLPEGDGWKRYEGYYLEESIFSFVALGNLRLSIEDFSYDSENDIYTASVIKGYSSIYNIEIKLNDTQIDYISYECDGTFTGVKRELHTLTLCDINATEIAGISKDQEIVKEDPIYYFEPEALATISEKTACFLAEYHYSNYIEVSPEAILSLRATYLGTGEYYTISLIGAKDIPGPEDDAEEIDYTYKITLEGNILSHEPTNWTPY